MQTRVPISEKKQTLGSKQPFFQAKLTVNEPGDSYEQEADAVADRVMRTTTHAADEANIPFKKVSISSLQRKCSHCEEEEKKIRRKESSHYTGGGREAPNLVSDVISGTGAPLDKSTKGFMESRIGQDFSGVQIHTDSRAAASAQSINALAYTSGKHIVFNSGQYQPNTDSGKRLLAHELVHVGQQIKTSTDIISREDKDSDRDITDPLEQMAGIVPDTVYLIILDKSTYRTRFLTKGGGQFDGTITHLTSSLSALGEYYLERLEKSESRGIWKIFFPNGEKYFGGLEFEVNLNKKDPNTLGYMKPVKLSIVDGLLPKLINIDERVTYIKDIANQYRVNDEEELKIIFLLSDIPAEQVSEFTKKLQQAQVNGRNLIERLDNVVDGENNMALHQALSKLTLQANIEKTTANLANAPVLAWHDVMGFFEQKSVFSITKTANGKIKIKYLGGVSGGLYSNPEYDEITSMDKRDRLNMMTGDGVEYDPYQPIYIHDYDRDKVILLTAESLISYQHAGVRKFLEDIGTIATIATPVGGETALAKVASYTIQAATIATAMVDENKLNIRKWFPKWGPDIIQVSEKIKVGLAIVGMAQMIKGSWDLFKNLKTLRNAKRIMNAALIAEDVVKAEQAAQHLEANADRLIGLGEKAKQELGIAEETSKTVAQAVESEAKAVTSPTGKTAIIENAIAKQEFSEDFTVFVNKELPNNLEKAGPSSRKGYSIEVPIEGTEHSLARKPDGTWCLFSNTPKGCGAFKVDKDTDDFFTLLERTSNSKQLSNSTPTIWDELFNKADTPMKRQSTGGFRSNTARQGTKEIRIIEGTVAETIGQEESMAKYVPPRKGEHSTHSVGMQLGENLPEGLTSAPARINLSEMKVVENTIREVYDNAKQFGGRVETKTILQVEYKGDIALLIGVKREAWIVFPNSGKTFTFIDFSARIDSNTRNIVIGKNMIIRPTLKP